MSERNKILGFIYGLITIIVINVAIGLLLYFLSIYDKNNYNYVSLYTMGWLLIGVVQFIYVSPLAIYLAIAQKWEFLKGITVGALLTFLLNGIGCYMMIMLINR
jgi:hypothetical protein